MNKRIVFHIDVNSAYLSWEAVYRLQHGANLDIRTVPAIVGGDPKTRRGIVLAKSIPAKKYGIQTGEVLFKALQKCPNLVIIPPNYHLYMKSSKAMHEILSEYSPSIQKFSIDESFMEFADMGRPFLEVAQEISDRILKELGFTVNIGISHNKLLAKVASDFQKPKGIHTLFPEEMARKMWPLPVEDLFMVGRATAPKLHKMGIYTIGDLAKADPELLKYQLKSHGLLVWQYANGIEDSQLRDGQYPVMKGMGNSSTISYNVTDRKDAHHHLLSLTEMVCMRLRDADFYASLVQVGVKNSSLSRYTHQKKLKYATNSTNAIYQEIKLLFDESWNGDPIRHLGVRVSHFSPTTSRQQTIWDPVNIEELQVLDRTIDDLRLKYGNTIIFRGPFANSKRKPVKGGVPEEDYPMMASML